MQALNSQDQAIIDRLFSQGNPSDIATAANLASLLNVSMLDLAAPTSAAGTTPITAADMAAIMSTTDIVPRFSTSNKYTESEQQVISQAIEILASKLVDQNVITQFTTSQAAKDFLQLKLATSEREIFAVMFLNNEHRLIAYEEMSVGTLDAASVYPREIVKRALDHGSASIILAHNHPSGKTTPSAADLRITKVIAQAAELFHIQVLDHIIVSVSETTSFKETGNMMSA